MGIFFRPTKFLPANGTPTKIQRIRKRRIASSKKYLKPTASCQTRAAGESTIFPARTHRVDGSRTRQLVEAILAVVMDEAVGNIGKIWFCYDDYLYMLNQKSQFKSLTVFL